MAKKNSNEISLIIVESPAKSKTISQFLGKDFKVESSYGHVRDLPTSVLGVDVENGFEPKYKIPAKAKPRVKNLLELLEKTGKVILATDGDREGEAIAWHLIKALGLETRNMKYETQQNVSSFKFQVPGVERIIFHEITKPAIEEALRNPRDLDMNLVNAQQTRRVLDRLVGYKLSPFLWKKIMSRLSAGRVQSVALRLIVDREEEIRKFIPEEYWDIAVLLKTTISNVKFEAGLSKINGEAVSKLGIKNKESADKIIDDIKKCVFEVSKIEKKEIKKNPLPPFTTSTLQQESFKHLRFSAKQTMRFAQNLYENGYITYMRTDSVNLSKDFILNAKKWIEENFGKQYASEAPRFFKTKSRVAQEAHEAIRPTNLEMRPENLPIEGNQEKKLYDLIWRRFVASQLPQAIFDSNRLEILALNKELTNKYLLTANGSILRFDGFLKIWPAQFTEKELPVVEQGEKLDLENILSEQHFTEPPARYNEASLVKILEEYGIGRPSTYAPIISVIQDRNYVVKNDQKRFEPTKIGEMVNKILVDHFPQIVDIQFTAKMESELDDIANGEKEWREVIKEFYFPFAKNLEAKYKEVEKMKVEEKTDEVCELCGKPMIIRFGRFGRFISCSGFPECKNTKSIITEVGVKCPKCGYQLVEKKSRRGKVFYGCGNYPNCNFALWNKPINELCPKCESLLVVFGKYSKVKCSKKECDYKRYGPIKDDED